MYVCTEKKKANVYFLYLSLHVLKKITYCVSPPNGPVYFIINPPPTTVFNLLPNVCVCVCV